MIDSQSKLGLGCLVVFLAPFFGKTLLERRPQGLASGAVSGGLRSSWSELTSGAAG